MAAPDDRRNVGAPVLQNEYIPTSRLTVTAPNTASSRVVSVGGPVQQSQRSAVPTPSWHSRLPTTIRSKPQEHSDNIRHYGRSASDSMPVQYTWDTGPSNVPGAAAYYSSRTFYKKKGAGTVQVPGCSAEASGEEHHEAYKSMNEDPTDSEKPRSLLMILSRTNARRASVNGKAQLRMQRQNKRMKFWRLINQEKLLFDWD